MMSTKWRQLLKTIMRKKQKYHVEIEPDDRFLSTVDLTCIGISITLGIGIFLILGDVAKYPAGPSVIISYLIAGVASFLAALCYLELSTRFPQSGSSYVYIYSCIGEFPAVLVSAFLLFDYITLSASSSKCLIRYINYLSNSTVISVKDPLYTNAVNDVFNRDLDLYSGLLVFIIVAILVIHKKVSPILSNLFMMICFLICIGIIMVAFFNADTENWTGGEGFFALGIRGITIGAARCYVTFISYDAIAIFGKNSYRRCNSLSSSYTNSFLVTLLITFGISVSTTLLAPYAMTRNHDNSALISLFHIRGVSGMQYIIIVGAFGGLSSTIITCISASSKLLQSLSEDGLIFSIFSKVHKKHQPIFSFIFCGLLSSSIAIFFDLNFLLNLIGFGAIIGSISVALCVLVLRYGTIEMLSIESSQLRNEMSRETSGYSLREVQQIRKGNTMRETTELLDIKQDQKDSFETIDKYGTMRSKHQKPGISKDVSVEYVNDSYVSSVNGKFSRSDVYLSEIEDVPSVSTFSNESKSLPSADSARETLYLILFSTVLIIILSAVTGILPRTMSLPLWYFYVSDVIVCLLLGALICILIALYRKPRFSLDPDVVLYKTPCIPLLPVSVVWTNTYLLTNLSVSNWITQLIITIIASISYLLYGKRNSKENYSESTLPDVPQIYQESQDRHLIEEQG